MAGTRVTHEEEMRIITLTRDNLRTAISKDIGRPVDTIARIQRKYHLVLSRTHTGANLPLDKIRELSPDHTPNAIAGILGVSRDAVMRMQEYYDVPRMERTPQRRPHTMAQEKRVITLSRYYAQSEIARQLNLAKTTVLQIQRKYHLVLRFGQSMSAAESRFSDWSAKTPDHRQEYWRKRFTVYYIDRGMTIKKIAEIVGLHPRTVSDRMNVLGIKRRNKQGERLRLTLAQLPQCECGRRIKTPDDVLCARCRRRPERLRSYREAA